MPIAPDRLNLLVLGTLLLTDGEGAVAEQASSELAAALDTPAGYSPAIQALFQDTRARIAGETESQRKAHDAELEREQREQVRLRQQVRDLGAELAANREESRFEIRNDILLAVGEVLQSIRFRDNLRMLSLTWMRACD